MSKNEKENLEIQLNTDLLLKNRPNSTQKGKFDAKFLFEDFSLGNLHLKNKLCYFNLTDNSLCDNFGQINENFFKFYKKIANSGVGLIFTGGAYAGLKKQNPKWKHFKLFYNDSEKSQLLNVTSFIHSTGTKIFFKIKSAFGRADAHNKFLGIFNSSVSSHPCFDTSFLPCVKLSDGKCDDIVDEIKNMSKLAKNTNFDGILIDGSLFGLIGEFLSPELNLRNFGYYSESLDFAKKIISKIKSISKTFPIFFELSLKSFVFPLYEKEASDIKTLKKFKQQNDDKQIFDFLESLIKLGVDGFVFKFGTFETEFLTVFNEFENENIFLSLYEKIDKFFKDKSIKNRFGSDVVLIYHDNFNNIFSLKKIKEPNFLFDITKNILANENYIFEVLNKKNFKNCIKCSLCDRASREQNILSCSINPEITNFDENINFKSLKNKKIAVVGAGISGIWCAIELAKMGETVDVFEQKTSLNSIGKSLEIFGFNEQFVELNDWIREQVKTYQKAGKINLILNKKFDCESVDYEKYDAIVVSTGLKEKCLNISGAVLKNVENIYDVLSTQNVFDEKNNIVISANSEISLSLAIFLLTQGKKVSIIIENLEFLSKISNDRLMFFLFELSKLGAKVYIQSKIKRIEIDFVEIWTNNKFSKLKFNSTILNLLSKCAYKSETKAKSVDCDLFIYEPETYPNTSVFYELVKKNFRGKLFMIGGSLQKTSLDNEIKSAHFVAKNINELS